MNWGLLALMLLTGLALSAFFSGSETGFYRVTRVRLVLDALDGDLIARALLWLTNNPSLFVATALVGNNLANYITSLAIVLITDRFVSGQSPLVELIVPVAFSPLVFVYGELLPKNLFFHAPNLLLRRTGPIFLLFTILLAPASALLWVLGQCLRWLLGESPQQVRLALARKELQQVLQEGQEAGILKPVQHELAQGLFTVAAQPVNGFCTPVARAVFVRLGDSKSEVFRLARRHGAAAMPVAPKKGRRLIGYVRIIDLHLDDAETIEAARPLAEIYYRETHSAALLQMQSEKQSLARLTDDQGETFGLLHIDQLTAPLFRRG